MLTYIKQHLWYEASYNNTTPLPLNPCYGKGYSDAANQVLLAENKNAPAVDKSKESLRYIRAAINLDVGAMQDVANVCFPDSDKYLQMSEEPSGLVLVDEKHADKVAGYVLWDEAEKTIYDMAVLPEYRKDANASSSKLLAEMARHVKESGGEWSAELRDNTTLRYMQAMAERGIIKLDVGDVDHEMGDGSKVYTVTFSALSPEKAKTPSAERQKSVVHGGGR